MQSMEQELPEQPQPELPPSAKTDEFYAGELQQDKIKNLISQIAPENQLEEIEMRIRGYKKNFYTHEWEKINKNSKLKTEPHELLVARYVSYLSSLMNQNTTMGNLSETQIGLLMHQIINWLTDDLDTNADRYGILHDYSERTRIGHIILNSTFLVLNRSLNGSEARRMWGAVNIGENYSMNQQQKKSPFEFIKFWK